MMNSNMMTPRQEAFLASRFLEVCSEGMRDEVERICRLFEQITPITGIHGKGIELAAREGHDDVVSYLLNHSPSKNWPLPHTINQAFLLAASGGFLSTLKILLPHASLDPSHATVALECAANSRSLETALFVLNDLGHRPNVSQALKACVLKENHDIFDILLPLADETFLATSLIVDATTSKSKEFSQKILSRLSPDQKINPLTISRAAEKKDASFLALFLPRVDLEDVKVRMDKMYQNHSYEFLKTCIEAYASKKNLEDGVSGSLNEKLQSPKRKF